MDVKKRDDESTMPKNDKLNNSETEQIKSSHELKLFDIFAKLKVENTERNSKSSRRNNNDIKEKSEVIQPEDEEEILDENDDNIKIESKSIEIEKTTAADVLKESKLDPKENFDLLKINLNFLVKKEFKWVVYRTPLETQKFFKKLHKSIKSDENAIKLGFVDLLEKVKEYKESDILNSIAEIKIELDKILQSPYFNNNLLVNEFFNIGGSSFSQYNNGIKPFEGWGLKKADPHCLRKAFGYVCICLECWIFKQYNERWIVLKDDMITYSDLSVSPGGKHVYFFDEEIKAVRNGKLSIKITNLSRVLELKFKNYFERELWKQEIEERIKKFKQIVKNNKYKAYTNEKMNNFAHWFIDGKDYFNDLYEKLMGAKRSIFITDWWMSPEVWLKRPILESDYSSSFFKKRSENSLSRLMDILEFKAKKGVKIYILLYYECSLALKLNSKHTQDTLEKLHKNIIVTRHPSDKLDLLWSHHEKLVIIDQTIGYVGGLDLCWGRYDFSEHPIYEAPNSEKKYYFPFIDYSNARICDFTNVENYLVESVPRESCLRMPWHDIHTRLIGPVVGDIARHFVERWNHARFEDRNQTSLNVQQSNFIPSEKKNKKLKAGGFLDSILESVKDQMTKEKNSTFKNESENPADKSFRFINTIQEEDSLHIDFDDEIDMGNIQIKETPIFNCQKNSLKGLGNMNNSSVNLINNENKENIEDLKKKMKKNNELKINLNLRQWKTQQEAKEDKVVDFSAESKLEEVKKQWMENFKEIDEDHFLVPRKLESKLISIPSSNEPKKRKSFYSELVSKIKKNKNNWFKDLFKVDNEIETIINDKYVKKGSIPSNVQVLRSVGEWSLGLKTKENSILEAYYQLIENSRHYIYIENQFFISKSFEDSENNNKTNKAYLVENKIALKIVNRILKASRKNEKFRVYVFIPLLPGFEGEPEKSGTLQIILKYTYESICRNNNLSIIEKLRKEMEKVGQNWQDYIGFYSLRNHSYVNGIPRTEIVYIHSKLMIVDDIYVICGSANINDRSMKGSRDSEFAALIKERRTEICRINGKKYKIAKFASSLRKALLAEHLGISEHDERLNDPLSDELHELIRNTAHNNTFVYHQVFGCYPDDCYTKFSMIQNKYNIQNKAQEEFLKKNYEENKHKIVGHIVEFPLHFLEEEQLGISFFSKENLVPERNFT